MSEPQELRRATDHGPMRRLVFIASLGWDWFEKRLILERAIAIAILYGTINVMEWAKGYATLHADAAANIAAVLAPYMLLQAAAVKFMFDRIGR